MYVGFRGVKLTARGIAAFGKLTPLDRIASWEWKDNGTDESNAQVIIRLKPQSILGFRFPSQTYSGTVPANARSAVGSLLRTVSLIPPDGTS